MSDETVISGAAEYRGVKFRGNQVFWDRAALAVAVIPFVLAYIVRVTLYVGAPADEAEWLVSTQSWRLAYEHLHPPLGVWLGRLVQLVFGGGLYTLLVLKFSILGGFIWFGYLTARRIMGPSAAALATAVTPMGMVFVAWEPLLSYTHSLFMLFFCIVSLYALVRLCERPNVLWYVLLGLSLSCGVLSKYYFIVFAAGLFVAALWAAPWRRLILDPKIIITFGVIVVACLPHFVYQFGFVDDMRGAEEVALAFRDQSGFFADRWAGFGSFVEAFFSLLLPAIVLIPLWFFPVFRQAPRSDFMVRAEPVRDLVWRWTAVLVVGYLLGVLIFGLTYIRTHHLYFLGLTTFPLMVEAFVRGASARRFAWFAGLMVALQMVAISVLVVRAFTDVEDCGKCHMYMPYDEIADDLRALGFSGGTIVSYSTSIVDIGENLKQYFPRSRVFSAKWPAAYPRPSEDAAACVVVWDADRVPGMYRKLTAQKVEPLLAPISGDIAHGVIRRTLHGSERPAIGIGYAVMSAGQQVCP